MAARIDLTGQRFGRLLVVSFSHSDKNFKPLYTCRCDCGADCLVRGADMKSGKITSCNCYRKEKVLRANRTHGETVGGKRFGTAYSSWANMKARCLHNHYYKKRGIVVCSRWESFENFLKDMGERPPGTSLDRINNDGNYSPKNCRWATRAQQSSNTTKTVLVSIGNKRLCIAAWAKSVGLKPSTLNHRIRAGWPMQEALTTPARLKRGNKKNELRTHGRADKFFIGSAR